MGCCSSKQEDPQIANERTHLLNGAQTASPDGIDKRMSYKEYEAMNQARLEDSLKKIVQKTAENLIDISRTQVERMKHQDTMERSNTYKTLMEGCKTLPPNVMNIFDLPANDLPKSPKDVLSKSRVTKEDLAMTTKALNDIQEAVEHMQIEYIGEFVVPLTFATPVGED
ncbi:hypothetical protein K493DRAFT_348211 [Basidiobolus meristosporus CBS 931.73]|uniref:Ragulator complex protein LAMTOR1 n=1 Tax=Basidiobolus meristosporus CBS 931.73 TaxID=1314790 RepID=A0A1Y1YPG5_9FUNG|nr:hypothetical protein K493DRAFT_348211 [Basidiobolus meristosporus CBS 931.73]|eukprot:ORX99917.1 hypothetical protein K493DRAFT_348211 [Basidiobolus meristosporus CBS 931.73]